MPQAEPTHAAVEGSPFEIRSKPTGRPEGYYTACVCGWTSAGHRHQAATLRELWTHIHDQSSTKETA